MQQRIVCEDPPMISEISKAFYLRDNSVIFSWGDIIYNPNNVNISPALIAHEAVHGKRQQSDVEAWWHEYIDNPSFRLLEETLAHMAEYRYLRDHSINRNQRRTCLKQTAKRLAAPLYGRMVTTSQAVKLLKTNREK